MAESIATAPNWTLFRDAYAAGLAPAAFLRSIRRLEAWSRLPVNEAWANVAGISDEPPRSVHAKVGLLCQKLQRELGLSADPALASRWQELFARIGAGSASADEVNRVARLTVLFEIDVRMRQQDPTLADPAVPEVSEETTARQATMQLMARFLERPVLAAGVVAPEALAELQAIAAGLDDIRRRLPSQSPVLKDVHNGLGRVGQAVVQLLVTAGRIDDAVAQLRRNVEYFSHAGEVADAAASGRQLVDLERRRSGQLDAMAEAALHALLQTESAADPFAQVEADIQLAVVAAAASDNFGAREHGDAAARRLDRVGYVDPARAGALPAFAAWLASAANVLTGMALFSRMNHVTQWYQRVLTARLTVALSSQPAVANELQREFLTLEECCNRLNHEAAKADADQQAAWLAYFPEADTGSTMADANPADAEQVTRRMRAVDAALEGVRDRCHARLETGAAMDDLITELDVICQEADALQSPVYETKARAEKAYVLGHANRWSEVPPVATEARRRLLGLREARLGAFTQNFERELYLRTLRAEVSAYFVQQDLVTGAKLCDDLIRDFETERYRVNSPYRQSALLGSFVDFYKWAAVAALKLERWDDLLRTIELIKARAALGTAAKWDAAEKEAIDQEFSQVTAQLRADPGNLELQARRRLVWDLRSTSRGSGATRPSPVQFSLAALQQVLREDEAAIGYFWLGESTLLTLAVDRRRFHAQRIALTEGDVARLREFSQFVQSLKRAAGSGMDRAIQRLGAVLLPNFLREFVAGSRRLILSPHHSLHLFPLHAISWADGEPLGARFAVRYAPNFSSLLHPRRAPAAARMLALAVETFADATVPQLDRVEQDVREFATAYRERGIHVEEVLGPAATRAGFDQLRDAGTLADFRYIHFGTHGLSVFESPEDPMNARLLLQDGALDCMDLGDLRLNADLIVMSACHSGQRAIAIRGAGELPGDDIFGLQAAFFQAGARAVLGTLWVAETESSSWLTRAFHRHHAATGEADLALQSAIRDYLADARTQRGAFYWAPYFLSCLGALPRPESQPVAPRTG